MTRVAIVGGGISGLALAYRLEQASPSFDVTVLEKRDRPGGTVWTERRDGFQVEIGPNGFLDTKPTTVQLSRDLGLDDALVPASEAAGKNRYLCLDGKLKALPSSFGSFLKSDLLSWAGKLNLFAEPLRRGRKAGGGDESIADFITRRAGREAADVLGDALVTGIFAGDPKLLSVQATFPRLVALEQEFGSLLRGRIGTARRRRAEAKQQGKPYQRPGKLWTIRAGLRVLIETLSSKLRRPPLLGVDVRRLERRAQDWLIHGPGNDRWEADVVVLACPAYEQAAIVAEVDAGLADLIGGIAYNRVTVIALGFRAGDLPRPLDGFGYIAPQRFRGDVLGVQWCSSIYPGRAPEGAVLLRAMCGGWHRPEVAGWSDERLVEVVRADLRQALGIQAAPIFQHLARWDRAIPQYHLGHLERVKAIEQRLRNHPGLHVAGNAYRGVALNDCTEQAAVLAQKIAREQNTRSPSNGGE